MKENFKNKSFYKKSQEITIYKKGPDKVSDSLLDNTFGSEICYTDGSNNDPLLACQQRDRDSEKTTERAMLEQALRKV